MNRQAGLRIKHSSNGKSLIDITICNNTLMRRKVGNYLGSRLDSKLTFYTQIQHAATKAAKVTSLLSRLMANIGGPVQSRRRLTVAITDSILRYGSVVRAEALKVACRMKIVSSVQRTAALRVA